jgi:N-acetylmuramoyl-L-alanine amidase
LKKERDEYFLCIDFDKEVSFVPRIHCLSSVVRILLSFNQDIEVPKAKKLSHNLIKGYFFERFSPSSLVFIVGFKGDVSILSKKYTSHSIKIGFKINKKRTVIIDAGHGGKDPGTMGVTGSYEKNVVMVAAVELRDNLLKSNKYRVILTREGDNFMPLDERIEKINLSEGNILISIHTDSNKDKNLRGMSFYTLPNSKDSRSQNFVDCLMKYIPKTCKIKNHPNRNSDLKILKTNIPSILIELGCISNKTDDELLHSRDFRASVINAILYALDDFFKKENK